MKYKGVLCLATNFPKFDKITKEQLGRVLLSQDDNFSAPLCR